MLFPREILAIILDNLTKKDIRSMRHVSKYFDEYICKEIGIHGINPTKYPPYLRSIEINQNIKYIPNTVNKCVVSLTNPISEENAFAFTNSNVKDLSIISPSEERYLYTFKYSIFPLSLRKLNIEGITINYRYIIDRKSTRLNSSH